MIIVILSSKMLNYMIVPATTFLYSLRCVFFGFFAHLFEQIIETFKYPFGPLGASSTARGTSANHWIKLL